ncbi:hypothetical protein [Microbaculum sp. FT89]|uniref:hypothetical protein n=1 Tax=Microbaculum sp. FT89 TaxID=3447298 RepID=UPI003F52C86A
MTSKLLAGLAAVALTMSAGAAFADCSAGHTAAKQTPVKTAQISTPTQTPTTQPAQD